MSCTFEFGIAPLPLRMDKELLDARCEDLASGVLTQDEIPLKTLSASCKRMRNNDSCNDKENTVCRTMESASCLDVIGHNY